MTDRAGVPGSGSHGPEELRRQIEQTRGQLGDTVAELAGRIDVKGRAQARAADLRDKAGAMTVQLRSTAAQAGHKVHDTATAAGHRVHDRALAAGHTAQERALRAGHTAQERTAETGHALERKAERGVPWPARPVVTAAVRHPRPALVIGAALVFAAVVAWRYPKKP
ncbi:DUF3618 domain-containing protein [Streptomyces sp. H51]|uniref:DUF3618 domain-containing protein n=1 Tax=Streptomyces sp. H51 TaxID=3111770 RepID=UPI002D78BB46|nr:DUF3618 domain-containing protein [Streptomyces sp. H51]